MTRNGDSIESVSSALPANGAEPLILVVDDAPTVRRHVAATLEPAGFKVLAAESGTAGMMTMRAHPQLSLVMLDFNMPGMNGLTLLGWMRSDPAMRNVPVVMLTTESAPSLVKRSRELGASAWLIKPSRPEHLILLAQKLTAGAQRA